MKEKHETFFRGLKEFCLTKNLANFQCLTNDEILKLEKLLELRFPQPFKIYLKHLGGDNLIRNQLIQNITRQSIIKAETQAKEKEIRRKIIDLNIVNEWDHSKIDESIGQICFIEWVDYNGYFSFIKLDNDLSNIYGWDQDKQIYKWENNLIGSIRKQILIALINDAKHTKLDDRKPGQSSNRLISDQILKDRKMAENIRKYNNRVLEEEKEKMEIDDVKTYIDNYIIERKNSGI